MVATLVKLKWRLTLNALSKNVWAIIGTVLGALYGLGALGLVLAGAVGLGLSSDPQVIALVLGSLEGQTQMQGSGNVSHSRRRDRKQHR